MTLRSFSFEFDEPLSWRHSADGERLVFQGPNAEELIVSGASVSGRGSVGEYQSIRQALHANAITAMKHAVDTPELIVEGGLRQGKTIEGLEGWAIDARSADGQAIFLQAAVLSDTGALLLTFEAPPSEAAKDFFTEFWSHVRVAGEVVTA